MAAARGVTLPEGYTGSSFLHRVLSRAAQTFPEALGSVDIPNDARAFKSVFGQVVVAFEAARTASPQRAEIARSIRQHVALGVCFVDDSGSRLLSEVMAEPAEPMPIEQVQTEGPGKLIPMVAARGKQHRAAALRPWAAQMCRERMMTEEVEAAVGRLVDRGETLSLKGERFVLMGAAAELSPAAQLLAAGADVLWLDLKAPDALRTRRDLGGMLHVPPPANILEQPAAIAATIRAFADDKPVHMGLYAYAGGESQEWRLTAAMNGIVASLPPEIVRSVSMLISPTTATQTGDADMAVATQRRKDAAIWKRLMGRTPLLKPSHVNAGSSNVACCVVPLQGASYQAAQYIGKVLNAEAIATWGPSLEGDPVTVSANVAPITATRSLSHPLFEAGFIKAPKWGIYISEPATTRDLQALIMIHDVTDPEAPGCADRSWPTPGDRGRALLAQQTHGGVFALPYDLIGTIQVAAVMGLASKPSLLLKIRG